MARKLRLEFPGACYHVINRGNYRADIFRDAGSKAAFRECLFAACRKSQWLLHAFGIMRNHFHLAIETPKGNLVAGMHWLEVTFATRFNRLRREHGHLFQGRYKAVLVEHGDPLGAVCHYINLNPVRAGVVRLAQLASHPWTSYWYLLHPRARLEFQTFDVTLRSAGHLTDTPEGWRRYAEYLQWQWKHGPAGGSHAYANLSRGWAIGSEFFKSALIADHVMIANARAWEIAGAQEIRTHEWERAVRHALRRIGRREEDILRTPKSDRWKLAVAAWMKSHTQATNRWLATRLHLGTPDAFSHNLTSFRRHHQGSTDAWRRLISSSVT